MKIRLVSCVILPVVCLSTTPAFAQGFWWWTPPVLFTHLEPANGALPDCSNAPAALGCSLFSGSVLNIQGQLDTDYDLFIIADGIDSAMGLAEIEFKIQYNDSIGAGVDVLGWTSCGDEVVTDSNWPVSGSSITVRFHLPENCQGSDPDTIVTIPPRGIVPLVTLRVRAHTSDVFELRTVYGVDSSILYKTCTGEIRGDFGVGSAGFGDFWGYDPCNGYYESHACYGGWSGYSCSCCYATRSCRPLAFYFSRQECHNSGGTPIYGPCTSCASAVEITTWSAIKTRHR